MKNHGSAILPSRRFITVVGSILCLGMLALAAHSIFFSDEKNRPVGMNKSQLHVASVTETAAPDADDDGLADWEEELLGTDPRNPDSDGNGTLDGEQHTTQNTYIAPMKNDDVLNYVNRLERTAQTAENKISATTQEEFTIPPNRFTHKDLYTTNTNSETMAVYAYNISGLITSYRPRTETNATEAIRRWVENPTEEHRATLNTMVELNTELIKKLARIDVPYAIAEDHTTLINAIDQKNKALQDALEAADDPTKKLYATARFMNFTKKQSDAIVAITNQANGHLTTSDQ